MRASPNSYLSADQLRRAAPAIFAEQPAASRSERYAFVPTVTVLENLADEGFFPVEAYQSPSRSLDGRPFAKHLIRMRRAADINITRAVGDVFAEVILTNSHDGASAYKLEGGLYRLACSNGMCTPESVQGFSVRHSGNIGGEVIDGCIQVVQQAEQFRDKALTWQGVQLSRGEQLLLADTAIKLRDSTVQIEPAAVLTTRRYADRGDDLFRVTNRIQEALVRGGVRGIGSTGKRTTTRTVAGVTENLKLNQAIMTLAEKFAELKAAA